MNEPLIVSPTMFNKMVDAGLIPGPKIPIKVWTRPLWLSPGHTRAEDEDDLERDRFGGSDGPDDPIWNSQAERWRNQWR